MRTAAEHQNEDNLFVFVLRPCNTPQSHPRKQLRNCLTFSDPLLFVLLIKEYFLDNMHDHARNIVNYSRRILWSTCPQRRTSFLFLNCSDEVDNIYVGTSLMSTPNMIFSEVNRVILQK